MGVSLKSLLRQVSLVLLAAVFVALSLPHKAAAAGFNVTVSPLPISLNAKPGETVTTPLSLQNNGSEPIHLNVSLMKFKAYGNTGEPEIINPDPNDQSVKWVSFSEDSFIAKPGVFKKIQMTIKVPKDAAFGYYYAVVFSQDPSDIEKAENKNKVNGAVASLVLLGVQTKGEKRQLQVTSFTSEKKVYQYLPATFKIAVHNSGNIHVVPSGNIFIGRNNSKDFIDALPINEEQGNVLPNSNRIFTVTWNDGFPSYQVKRQNGQVVSDKRGKPVTELNWDLKNASKFRFGRYVASMTLVYNDGTRDVPVNGEVTFWVIPWVPLLILLTITLLVCAGMYMIGRTVTQRVRRVTKKKEK